MSKKLYEETVIQGIADAIRNKNGKTDKYKVADMANAINAIETGGGSAEKINFTNGQYLFAYDRYNKLKDIAITNGVTDGSYMFNLTDAEEVDVTQFDVSNVVNWLYAFQSCKAKSIIMPSNMFDTAMQVTGMFRYCNNLTVLELNESFKSNTNFSTMAYFLQGCTKLKTVDWESLFANKENLQNISYLFESCIALEKVDLSALVSQKLTTFAYMFRNCTALSEIVGIENLNTANVANITNMFYGCSNLKELDLSGWNTAKMTLASAVFTGCTNLQKITFGSGNTRRITSSLPLGSDGYWYNANGANYAPNAIPLGAGTYWASKDLIGS